MRTTRLPIAGHDGSGPRVLVILASYNGENWILEQVKSILSQEEVQVTVVIGDDASSDNTVNLVRGEWSDDGRVRVAAFKESSGSAGENFRRLLAAVDPKGFDYVAFSDQDDIWMSRKLIRAVKQIQSDRSDAYSGAVTAFWPDGKRKNLKQCGRVKPLDFLFEGAGQGCTFVLTESLFKRVQKFCISNRGLVSGMHFHDWMVYLLARAWECRWSFDPDPCMLYRQHAGNEIGSRGVFSAVIKRIAQIKNGWYCGQILKSIEVYRVAAVDSSKVDLVSNLLKGNRRITNRVKLGVVFLFYGRRRFVDRVAMSLFAIAGWI